MNHNTNRNFVWHVWYASNLYRNSPMSLPYELKKVEKENNDNFNKRFGVLCLTTQYDNDAMWNKYADYGQGFCIDKFL